MENPPEKIISHILAYFDAKIAVRSALISRNFYDEFIWRNIKSLRLCDLSPESLRAAALAFNLRREKLVELQSISIHRTHFVDELKPLVQAFAPKLKHIELGYAAGEAGIDHGEIIDGLDPDLLETAEFHAPLKGINDALLSRSWPKLRRLVIFVDNFGLDFSSLANLKPNIEHFCVTLPEGIGRFQHHETFRAISSITRANSKLHCLSIKAHGEDPDFIEKVFPDYKSNIDMLPKRCLDTFGVPIHALRLQGDSVWGFHVKHSVAHFDDRVCDKLFHLSYSGRPRSEQLDEMVALLTTSKFINKLCANGHALKSLHLNCCSTKVIELLSPQGHPVDDMTVHELCKVAQIVKLIYAAGEQEIADSIGVHFKSIILRSEDPPKLIERILARLQMERSELWILHYLEDLEWCLATDFVEKCCARLVCEDFKNTHMLERLWHFFHEHPLFDYELRFRDQRRPGYPYVTLAWMAQLINLKSWKYAIPWLQLADEHNIRGKWSQPSLPAFFSDWSEEACYARVAFARCFEDTIRLISDDIIVSSYRRMKSFRDLSVVLDCYHNVFGPVEGGLPKKQRAAYVLKSKIWHVIFSGQIVDSDEATLLKLALEFGKPPKTILQLLKCERKIKHGQGFAFSVVRKLRHAYAQMHITAKG